MEWLIAAADRLDRWADRLGRWEAACWRACACLAAALLLDLVLAALWR